MVLYVLYFQLKIDFIDDNCNRRPLTGYPVMFSWNSPLEQADNTEYKTKVLQDVHMLKDKIETQCENFGNKIHKKF